MEYGTVAASHADKNSDPAYLGILAETLGSTLESLDITLADHPASEFPLFNKFTNLQELSLNKVHYEQFSTPAMAGKLRKFQANIPLNVYPSICDILCSSMSNLTFLGVGSSWLSPEIVTKIGNSLLNLKTLSLNGNSADIVDALAATPLAKSIESLLSSTLDWTWIQRYLVPEHQTVDVLLFPELRYVQVTEEVWAPPYAQSYPLWKCYFNSNRDEAPSTVLIYPGRKYCVILEHRMVFRQF